MNAYIVNLFYQVGLRHSLQDKTPHFTYVRTKCTALSNKNEDELWEHLNKMKRDPYLRIAVECPTPYKEGAISEADMVRFVKKATLSIAPEVSQFIGATNTTQPCEGEEESKHHSDKYDWVDNFTSGLARVVKNDKWGVIDLTGKEVIPVEYDCIRRIGEESGLIRCSKKNIRTVFHVKDLIHDASKNERQILETPEPIHYGAFAGTYAQDIMGFDDDTINDAFEGDPDACWNVD